MRTDYSDQDTERVRQAERSSAGQSTQPLRLPDVPAGAVAAPLSWRRPSGTALLLIGIGIVLLLARGFGESLLILPGMILFII